MHQSVDFGDPRIVALYRYPVKGFSPEALRETDLEAGQPIRHDRRYAVENGPGRFDAQAPRHLPKINFLMLMRNERLATLTSQFDDASETLTLSRDGRQLARGQLSTRIGRQLIEQFLAAYLKDDLRGPPRLLEAPGHSFSDVAAKCVHIINLASLRAMERIAGRSIDPLRFRANVVVDGLAPWAEFDWIEKDVHLGSATVRGYKRTERCDATDVDPQTAVRDMAIPAMLRRTLGHADFGVYAIITHGGKAAVGDPIKMKVN